jgi:hypothetical protein
MSTLAAGSLLTLVSIVFGSALTMKTEFYLLDGVGVLRALRLALSDMHLAPRPGAGDDAGRAPEPCPPRKPCLRDGGLPADPMPVSRRGCAARSPPSRC